MPPKGYLLDNPINKKFGKLTVLKVLDKISNGKPLVKCLCECGKIKIARIDSVRKGDTKSCGCIKRLNITNNTYEFLTAIRYAGEDRVGNSLWEFECICKNKVIRNAAQVKAKNTLLHCGCRHMKPHEPALNALYKHYEYSAKKRNIKFNLNKKQFKKLTSSKCFYCNSEPFALKDGPSYRAPYVYTGIDRFNNKLGYNLNNCVPCCKICNVAKAMYTSEIFYAWVKKIYKNLKNKGVI